MNIQHHPLFNSQMNHFKIEIYNSGYAQLDSDWDCHDAAGSMCYLYFIKSGKGKIICNDKTILIKPETAYFIPAGVTWYCGAETEICKFFLNLNILKPNGENLFIDFPSIVEIPFSLDKIQQMIEWYLSDQTEKWFFLKSMLYEAISEIIRKSELKTTVTSYHPLTLDTIKYIQNNLSLNITLQALADRSFVSKTFLASQFKKEIGMSVGQYIDLQILVRSRIDLEQQKLSIAEISNKYGFCDQFYFSRFFKKHVGESPSQYRSHFASSIYNVNASETKHPSAR